MVTRQRHSLYFEAPGRVVVRAEPAPAPGTGEVRVRSLCSAISAGTELLLYRGEAPAALSADETLPSLAGNLAYPLKYGYAAVGEVVELGPHVSADWLGARVFAFNPHETEFTCGVAALWSLADGVMTEDALFLANMETAVSLLHDGHAYAGERVVVLGAGVVGLLTTALLARMPLENLIAIDAIPLRRERARQLGATAALDPADAASMQQLEERADVVFELTGAPAALNTAIQLTGFAGRVVIGSWYGTKRAELDLGGRFHRSRIQLIASQVSTLAPALQARWTKARRFEYAQSLLGAIRPSQLITHRVPFADAPNAYAMLARHNPDILQMVLTYDA